MTKATCINRARTALGEGPIWYDNVLYRIDVETKRVFLSDAEGNEQRCIQLNERVGTVVPRKKGGVVIAGAAGFAFLDPETEQLTPLCDPEAHLPGNRFNDGKCDPQGRFWAGSMNANVAEAKFTGSLYMLDHEGVVHRRLTEVGISNGLCWSADSKTMYYIDTFRHSIDAFDFEPERGNISNRRVITQYPEHLSPDGMTIDANGNLWTAIWGGYRVDCHDPKTGQLLHQVEVAAQQVSACTFGGKDLKTLYITTASVDLSEEQLATEPLAGGLFAATPGAQGVPSFAYGG